MCGAQVKSDPDSVLSEGSDPDQCIFFYTEGSDTDSINRQPGPQLCSVGFWYVFYIH